MKKLLIIAGWALFLSGPRIAEAGTLFTAPVIFVTPMTLVFGTVAAKASATNSFLVENMGKGRLVGTATVAAPFRILSGGNYSLKEKEVQIVAVVYSPTGTNSDTQIVKFTGGGGAAATVTSKLPAPAPKKSKRK